MTKIKERNCVIISPHCGNEYLGCSTILSETKEIITICDCGEQRTNETKKCAGFFGIPTISFLGFKKGRVFDSLNILKDKLNYFLLNYTNLDNITVYLPNPWEQHLDYKTVSMIGSLVCKELNLKVKYYSVWTILSCYSDMVDIDKNAKISEFKKLYPSQSDIAERVILRFEEFLDMNKMMEKASLK